jgi:small subunit ribosomal protein S16
MVRIRMQRFGRTHRPFYRINAIDIRTRRNGKVIENLGWYNPMAAEGQQEVELKEDRIRHWIEKGAQPSETMRDMLGHRDLLTPKQKAEWEADREKSRNRVSCKTALAKAEAALKALEELGESAEADPAAQIDEAKAAVEDAKKAVSSGKVDKAEAAAAKAEAALETASKNEADAKAKAEAAAKAEEEAKAAEGDGDSSESSEESAEG